MLTTGNLDSLLLINLWDASVKEFDPNKSIKLCSGSTCGMQELLSGTQAIFAFQ